MTRRDSSGPRVLTEEREAIRDYLDALLREIPETDEASAPAPAATEHNRAVEVAPVDDSAAPVQQEAAAAAPAPPASARADAAPASGEDAGGQRGEPLQALFFSVGGLRLAVPLTELHSVVPWAEVEITAMPGQPEWQRGLMRYRERNVRVVDTVTLVLPPQRRASDEARAAPQHVLVVGDGRWGLACHGIGDIVRLGADEVKWRRREGARPWLAGTVIGHLSALIDTHAFGRMLGAGG